MNSQQIITELKRELKRRELTYAALAQRLRDVAQEINALHLADARLPYSEKGAQTLLLALRPWMPPALRNLRNQGLPAVDGAL